MKTNKSVLLLFVTLFLAVAAILTTNVSYAATPYDPSEYLAADVALVNRMIDENGLKWTKDDPASWTGVTWSETLPRHVEKLDISNQSLTGTLNIRHFSGLTYLDCSHNNLTFDVNLFYTPNLTYLDCSYNQISDPLFLPKQLTYLDCSYNNITKLEFYSYGDLTTLLCQNNRISRLELDRAPALTGINCSANNLEKLDVSQNMALKILSCAQNNISEFDLSQNTALTDWSFSENPLKRCVTPKGVELRFAVKGNGKINIPLGSNLGWQLEALPSGSSLFHKWAFDPELEDSDESTVQKIHFALKENMTVTANFIDPSEIIVTPAATDILPGQTRQFSANAAGIGSLDGSVVWTVEGAQSADTSIDQNGLLRAGADETAKMLTVRAAYTKAPNISGAATVQLGHSFGGWEVIQAPSCTAQGTKQRQCTVCSLLETQDMSPTGHIWEENYTVDKEPTCTAEGSRSVHCKNCGIVKESMSIPPIGHVFGEWSQPVKEGSGLRKTRTCSVCGYIEKLFTEAPEISDPNKIESTQAPGTGETTLPIYIWIALSFMAMTFMVWSIHKIRRTTKRS